MPYRILTLNTISPRGLERLPRERYEVGADVEHPDAILLRSLPVSEPGSLVVLNWQAKGRRRKTVFP